ncbi:MAG: acyl-CoA dehydrogenase family protein [Acidobacteria bacterium]|nr:acyl-CoA dehydrogenase family protein [Acidobacteriota bacterium]
MEADSAENVVAEFAATEIAPGVAERERKEEFPRAVIDSLAGLGILGMMVPEEYGGSAADALSYILVIEELARVCASVAVIVSVTNSVFCFPVWKYGSDEQKKTILSEVASGKSLGAYALTEPQSGSDAANQKTRAIRDGNGYVLNGSKAWITNAGEAGWYLVMAMTDPAAGTRGITGFLVSAADEGLRIGPPEDKMGLRSSKTASIYLEDLRLSESRRLGAEGDGFRIAMTTLDHSRIGIAAQGVGIARACYDASTEYAKTRETFGRKLAEHEIIAFQIADMKVQIDAARLLTYRAALLSEKPGVRFSKEASMAKVFATEAANTIAARAVQIFGGYGYSREYPVERFYRDARVTTIYEGTSEIQRIVISKNVLAEA